MNCRFFVLAITAMLVQSGSAGAQSAANEGAKPELRVDAIASDSRVAIQGGAGLEVPAGYYARIGVVAAVGGDAVPSGRELSGRVDVLARFLFDPFRETRWGFSAGAGVSLRVHEHDRIRPYLLSVIDLEAPRPASGIAPAFQLGLGGGVRFGMALRWGGPNTR